VAPITLNLQLSADNSTGKYPEYARIWEDGHLVITAVFGKNDANSKDLDDPGVQGYRNLYQSLMERFGQPLSNTLAADHDGPTADDKFVKMSFQTDKGIVDVELDLIGTVGSDADKDFEARYNERTLTSDFISYNGHSGLGSNIATLLKLGQFAKSQYQIIFLNGCDTFSYVSETLRSEHQALNPDEGPDKYVDIVLNTLPSYFDQGPKSNFAMIDALATETKTYRQILASIDPSQRMVVTGEQDNAEWVPPADTTTPAPPP
jgi:hypothetical protein